MFKGIKVISLFRIIEEISGFTKMHLLLARFPATIMV
jgi:hypothetical protein